MNAITTPNELAHEIALAEHAAVIRALGKRVISDIIEIGRRLGEAQAVLSRESGGDGTFLQWIEREFPSWSQRAAYRFIDVYKAFRGREFAKLANSELDLSSLYLFAAPSTPEEARQEVGA
jgi:hypothetical protein